MPPLMKVTLGSSAAQADEDPYLAADEQPTALPGVPIGAESARALAPSDLPGPGVLAGNGHPFGPPMLIGIVRNRTVPNTKEVS